MEVVKSQNAFSDAQTFIPGGVNSPVRAAKSVDSYPLFIKKGKGPYIYDIDGNKYVDYVGSWGPLILGHAHPRVIDKIKEIAENGTSFGAPTEIETELAKMVVEMVPSIEMVRFVNSGTEATMSALRLARAYTNREIVIKFDGCYHGHADSFLVQAGSGVATLGIPGSPGVPESLAKKTISLPYNNLEAVKESFKKYPDSIAAVIVEPVAGNMGVIPPKNGFLKGLEQLCKEYGALLIFDEVITGFRLGLGGAQSLYGITPDLTCLGKIIGGGLPVGAYGGKREIMENIAPVGPVYQAGTLSGNPLAMAAGLETLKVLREENPYPSLEENMGFLIRGFAELARDAGIPVQLNHVGSMGAIFFAEDEILDFESAKRSKSALYTEFYKVMREEGVYLAPSPFEAIFISTAHTQKDIEYTLRAAKKSFYSLA